MDHDLKILLIGPFPPPVGGATVLLKQLADDLANMPGVCLKTINTSRSKPGFWNMVGKAAGTLKAVLANIRSADVISLHVSLNGSYFGGVLRAICWVFNKPFVFRSFGAWNNCYDQAPRWGRFLLRHSTLHADAVLLETKAAVDRCRLISTANICWYSNSRVKPNVQTRLESDDHPRFMFLGHVSAMKGIHDLIEAGEQVRQEIDIDIYGPILEGVSINDFSGTRVSYRGIISPDEIYPVMCRYDVLVMPSRRAGEGYPGVIIESFMVGMPVIATRVGAIPEIVNGNCGILVEPRQPVELANAISSLATSPQLIKKLKAGASEAATQFEARKWSNEFLRVCCDVARRRHLHREN